ncbi:catalase [Paraburkholderia sp. MM5496-R1]
MTMPGRADHQRGHGLLLRWLAVFAAPMLLLALFVWCAGWFPPRLTSQRIVDAFEATTTPHPGFRRNHAKGICITGHFDSNGNGASVSRASVFERGSYAVVGRLSRPGGNPQQDDGEALVRSFALLIALPHGEQWRLAMNSTPIFAVRTPQALFEQLQAEALDPHTGQANPAKMQAFLDGHPEARAFLEWVRLHPPSSRFDNAAYFGISSFQTTDAQGAKRFVRWEVVPDSPWRPVEARAQSDPDFLSHALMTQLAKGPLRWHLVLNVAMPGDPIDDSTRQWVDSPQRERVDVGTIVIDRAQAQIDGPCRDITFDPTILPDGIAPSADPLLAARSSTYSVSFNRRTREEAVAGSNGH